MFENFKPFAMKTHNLLPNYKAMLRFVILCRIIVIYWQIAYLLWSMRRAGDRRPLNGRRFRLDKVICVTLFSNLELFFWKVQGKYN